ncbi:hypothetical protein INT45_013819 [Circinella minor]|uniref:CCHC-type domain-containing protein n=1 Tax=Circinella minor TaxID=1195481 RepID=A0A8H7RV73_9FUNG|nr:hypothetical protein INT45_013819 [Circinella minor]
MVLRPLNVHSQQWRIVSFFNRDHNHKCAQEISSYSMACRLNTEEEAIVINMIKSHATNNSILSFLASKGKIINPKDVTNLRQTVFNNDPQHTMFNLIKKLEEKGYESGIALARKFPETVVLDATYKTNKHRLPFVNVVGTSNIGYPHLKTFCIAGGWVSQETNETYKWVIQCLQNIVWPSNQSAYLETFVTDSEGALVKALDKVFPNSKKLLCKVHLRRNFRTKLQKLFDVKDDYQELEKAVNFLMTDQYNDELENMCVIPDEKFEAKALAKYNDVAQKAKNLAEVIKYLKKKLEFCEKWVGCDIANIVHFGNNSTNCVEEAHADLKRSIQSSSGNLSSVFEQIDEHYRLKNVAWKQQHDKEYFTVNPYIPELQKERLINLERNISKFAFYAICDELKHRNILKTNICRCAIKAHYNIPCCYMLPATGAIPLNLIPRRWHLYTERTALEENTNTNNADNVLAITESYIPFNVEDHINDELTRINTLLYKYTHQKQRQTLLQRLKAINDNLFMDLEGLQQPKTLPKRGDGKKHQELESQKKAKTMLGRKSAKIWEGKHDTLDNTQPTCDEWKVFKQYFLANFSPPNRLQLARDRLAALVQTSTAANFVSQFQAAWSSVPSMIDKEAMDRFQCGLTPTIRLQVMTRFPSTTDEAMRLALAVEAAQLHSQTILGEQFGYSRSHKQPPPQLVPEYLHTNDVAPMDLDTIRSQRSEQWRSTGHSRPNQQWQGNQRNNDNNKECYNCGGLGHISRFCSSPRHTNSNRSFNYDRQGGRQGKQYRWNQGNDQARQN